VIKGAISRTIEVGRRHREAVAAGENAAAAIAECCGGRVLFCGRVSAHEWDTVNGYTEGTLTVDAGNEYRIWYRNENIIAWRDGEYFASVPDLLCVFNNADGMPVLNPLHKTGMDVTVIGIPSDEKWRVSRGVEVFGPRSFGLRRTGFRWKSSEPPSFFCGKVRALHETFPFFSIGHQFRYTEPNLLQQGGKTPPHHTCTGFCLPQYCA
jgi:DUF917 family protein